MPQNLTKKELYTGFIDFIRSGIRQINRRNNSMYPQDKISFRGSSYRFEGKIIENKLEHSKDGFVTKIIIDDAVEYETVPDHMRIDQQKTLYHYKNTAYFTGSASVVMAACFTITGAPVGIVIGAFSAGCSVLFFTRGYQAGEEYLKWTPQTDAICNARKDGANFTLLWTNDWKGKYVTLSETQYSFANKMMKLYKQCPRDSQDNAIKKKYIETIFKELPLDKKALSYVFEENKEMTILTKGQKLNFKREDFRHLSSQFATLQDHYKTFQSDTKNEWLEIRNQEEQKRSQINAASQLAHSLIKASKNNELQIYKMKRDNALFKVTKTTNSTDSYERRREIQNDYKNNPAVRMIHIQNERNKNIIRGVDRVAINYLNEESRQQHLFFVKTKKNQLVDEFFEPVKELIEHCAKLGRGPE